MFDKIKLSIKTKLMAFGFSLIFGGSAILAMYVGSMTLISRTQALYEKAEALHTSMSLISDGLHGELLALQGYLLDPTKKGTEIILKHEGQKVDDGFNEAQKDNFDPELADLINQAIDYDKSTLRVLSTQVMAMSSTNFPEAITLLTDKYMPAHEQLVDRLNKIEKLTSAYQSKVKTDGAQKTKWITLILAVAIIIGSGFGFLLTRILGQSLIKGLSAAIEQLGRGTALTRTWVAELSTMANDLAKATTEQSSALAETASSIEEMDAMTKKNADNASRSGEVAKQSSEAAKKGKQAVEEMMNSIKDIDVSNQQIMAQIDDSNTRITEISTIIAAIGAKTNVINDIVFQTRLLSFNASVEAARAGEHGKGFAVVAEEVGNLAQMSGVAAKEIGDLLNESTHRVQTIVSETKTKVGAQMSEGKSKVEAGARIAEQSGVVLDEIVQKVDEMTTMIGEISVASQEQSVGISEITKAVNELDKITHANSTTSKEVAGSSEKLFAQSQELRGLFHALEEMVYGESTSTTRGKGVAKKADAHKENPPHQLKIAA